MTTRGRNLDEDGGPSVWGRGVETEGQHGHSERGLGVLSFFFFFFFRGEKWHRNSRRCSKFVLMAGRSCRDDEDEDENRCTSNTNPVD